MTQMIRILITSIFLAICGIEDCRQLSVSVPLCALTAGAAAVLCLAESGGNVFLAAQVMPALVPGCLLLCLALAAGDMAGTGDGICFLILGVLLGTKEVWILLTAALLLLSLCSIVLLCLKRAGKRTKMPFLTFTAAAWAGILLVRLAER